MRNVSLRNPCNSGRQIYNWEVLACIRYTLSLFSVFHADSMPPQVEETVPAAGVIDGYPDEPVVAWLDEPFPGLPPESRQIRDEDNVLAAGNLSAVRREGVGFEPPPTGIEFTPLGDRFAAPAVYTATVGAVTDYCLHPVVAYTWKFTMVCLYEDAGWDSTIGVAACDGQQFALETGQSELAPEYEWQVIVDGGPKREGGVWVREPVIALVVAEPGRLRDTCDGFPATRLFSSVPGAVSQMDSGRAAAWKAGQWA